ncbi:hypothetical protein [Pseudochryseolinea flava]|nr:hypothetical protein [Pseudochryseolinea flava]
MKNFYRSLLPTISVMLLFIGAAVYDQKQDLKRVMNSIDKSDFRARNTDS